MKKTDIAMIALIACVSLLTAYVVMDALFGSYGSDKAEIQTIRPIDSTIVQPNPKIFNSEAINPTVTIVIGGESAQP